MKQFRNIWFPDSEKHIIKVMEASPMVLYHGKGVFQFEKLKAAVSLVKDRGHAVDIGAHVGLWSHVLSGMFEKVTAFEPVPINRECFEVNVDSPNVTMNAVALGATPGTMQMHVHAKCTAWSGAEFGDWAGNLQVEVRTLDSFDLPKINFIKIDTEGYEDYVLLGAKETIMRDKPVMIVEQKPGIPGRYGLKDKGAIERLKTWGAIVKNHIHGDYVMAWE